MNQFAKKKCSLVFFNKLLLMTCLYEYNCTSTDLWKMHWPSHEINQVTHTPNWEISLAWKFRSTIKFLFSHTHKDHCYLMWVTFSFVNKNGKIAYPHSPYCYCNRISVIWDEIVFWQFHLFNEHFNYLPLLRFWVIREKKELDLTNLLPYVFVCILFSLRETVNIYFRKSSTSRLLI